MKNRALSPSLAAPYLGVSTNTVRRWIAKGLLRPMVTPSDSKYGQRYKISIAELDRFKADHALGRKHAPKIKGE